LLYRIRHAVALHRGFPDHVRMAQESAKIFDLDTLRREVVGAEPRYFEFFAGRRLSGGLYRLPAGAHDLQSPHLEDEVYLVLEGRARLKTADAVHDIGPGNVLFIEANLRHAFVDIREDLTLLALFSASGEPWQR
jgi:mannose-6-phosphate isomerase-like protein (cupin superfamily)